MTRGFLNLTHRDSHEFPEPLEPGRSTPSRFPLKAVGQTIARRQSHPARALADVLAVRLALPGRGVP